MKTETEKQVHFEARLSRSGDIVNLKGMVIIGLVFAVLVGIDSCRNETKRLKKEIEIQSRIFDLEMRMKETSHRLNVETIAKGTRE